MDNMLILNRPENQPPVFSPEKGGETYNAIMRIIELCTAKQASESAPSDTLGSQFCKNGIVLELLAGLLRENCVVPTIGAGISTQNFKLDRIISRILQNPAQKMDMAAAAEIANMSYYAFSRLFKASVGMNFTDYCNLLRIRLAEDKLIATDMPISEIAEYIGIDTPSYFSRLFKNINGMTPIDFRKNNRLN